MAQFNVHFLLFTIIPLTFVAGDSRIGHHGSSPIHQHPMNLPSHKAAHVDIINDLLMSDASGTNASSLPCCVPGCPIGACDSSSPAVSSSQPNASQWTMPDGCTQHLCDICSTPPCVCCPPDKKKPPIPVGDDPSTSSGKTPGDHSLDVCGACKIPTDPGCFFCTGASILPLNSAEDNSTASSPMHSSSQPDFSDWTMPDGCTPHLCSTCKTPPCSCCPPSKHKPPVLGSDECAGFDCSKCTNGEPCPCCTADGAPTSTPSASTTADCFQCTAGEDCPGCPTAIAMTSTSPEHLMAQHPASPNACTKCSAQDPESCVVCGLAPDSPPTDSCSGVDRAPYQTIETPINSIKNEEALADIAHTTTSKPAIRLGGDPNRIAIIAQTAENIPATIWASVNLKVRDNYMPQNVSDALHHKHTDSGEPVEIDILAGSSLSKYTAVNFKVMPDLDAAGNALPVVLGVDFLREAFALTLHNNYLGEPVAEIPVLVQKP